MAFELIQSTKMNQGYVGHAEQCTWEFTVPLPEQLAEWPAQQMIWAHQQVLAAQNARLLELKVYRDVSPDFTTVYKVITTSTASPLFWNLIIIGVLAAVIAIAVAWSITEIKDIPVYVSSLWAIGLGAVAVAVIVVSSKKGESYEG